MNIKIEDGPAGGSTFEVDRTPMFLRLAVDEQGEFRWATGKGESLRPGENGYAYRRFARAEPGGQAMYRMVVPQPYNNQMREFAQWEQWVKEQLEPAAGKATGSNGEGKAATGEPDVPASTSAQA